MHNITVNPDDPMSGDVVHLVGPDGVEDGRETKVREVLSTGPDGLYEVRDDRGQAIIVQWADQAWVEVPEA